MAKHPPRRRPKSEDSPKPPRHRLAEIQAEIHAVQQQIEQLRRAARVIRNAQDVRAWERQITDLTDRLSGLLWAEAMQRASDHPENIQSNRSVLPNPMKQGFPRTRTSVRQALRSVVQKSEIRKPPYFWLRRGLNGYSGSNAVNHGRNLNDEIRRSAHSKSTHHRKPPSRKAWNHRGDVPGSLLITLG